MARIVHIALKVEDLEKTSQFYENVFGFRTTETSKVRDHTSRHLSDGAIDLALIKYDSEDSAEAKASGQTLARFGGIPGGPIKGRPRSPEESSTFASRFVASGVLYFSISS